MVGMKIAIQFMQPVQMTRPDRQLCQKRHQAKGPDQALPINDAIQIKAAECWLRLGEADRALRELESLPHKAWSHPSAVRVRVAAIEMLKGQSEMAV
jgi:hypothetical protein